MSEGMFYILKGAREIGNDKTIEEYFTAYKEKRKAWAEGFTQQIIKALKTAHRLGTDVYVQTYNDIFKKIVPKFCLKAVYGEYAETIPCLGEACLFFEDTFQECASEVESDYWLPRPNFLYTYFEDRFKDDCRCIVTEADIKDIINKCERIVTVDVALNETKEEIEGVEKQIKTIVNSMCNQTKPDEECADEVKQHLAELREKYEKLVEKRDCIAKVEPQAPLLLPGQSTRGVMACGYDEWYYGNIKTCAKELPLLLKNYDEKTDVMVFVWGN